MKEAIAVVGAGGCAREVAWTLRDVIATGAPFDFVGHVVTDGSHNRSHPLVSAPVTDLNDAADRGIRHFVLGVGNPPVRVKVLDEVQARVKSAKWPAIVHPSVLFDRGSVRIGEGVVICAGTILTVNVSLGPFTLVHYACTISHETTIGTNSVLNPSCNISGGVEIGDRVVIGVGAQVLQYLRIGSDAVVGAGAVVTRNVEPGSTAVGVPARPRYRK